MTTSHQNFSRGISAGLAEIDRQFGNGLPWGSLTLVEGAHASGKTVLCQHLTRGALREKAGVAYYTSEMAAPSLVSQMGGLGLDVLDYFLQDKLRIYPLTLSERYPQPVRLLDVLGRHLAMLSPEIELIVVDSLTPLLPHCPRGNVEDFFRQCRQLTCQGKTIVLVLDTRRLLSAVAERIRFWCDVRLGLRMEPVLVERVVKALDVFLTPAQGVGAATVNFEVCPGRGIRIISPGSAVSA